MRKSSGTVEIEYEYYEWSTISFSKVCYDDLSYVCNHENIPGIVSIEAIYDFNGGEVEDYFRIFYSIQAEYQNAIIIIPFHTLMKYENKEFIAIYCYDIDSETFLPFPYCKYNRFIFTGCDHPVNINGVKCDTRKVREMIPILKTAAVKQRIATEMRKSGLRHQLIKSASDEIDGFTSTFSYKAAAVDEMDEYVRFLNELTNTI